MKKNNKMKLVRQIIYKRNDPEYKEMDELCFKSKNLYNATLYAVRQSFIILKRQYAHVVESVDTLS